MRLLRLGLLVLLFGDGGGLVQHDDRGVDSDGALAAHQEHQRGVLAQAIGPGAARVRRRLVARLLAAARLQRDTLALDTRRAHQHEQARLLQVPECGDRAGPHLHRHADEHARLARRRALLHSQHTHIRLHTQTSRQEDQDEAHHR